MVHKNSYNIRKRYRERSRQRTATFVKVAAFFIVTAFLAGWIGRNYNESRQATLQKKLGENRTEILELQEELLEARAQAQTASARYTQLKDEISKELPNEGPLRELVAMIRDRLDEGMDPERLEFIILSARPPRNCSDPVTRRFIVKTPALKGPDSAVDIGADDEISVSGSGTAAKSKDGDAEAWFDPAKPVAIAFETKSGLVETKEGNLPIYHSLVVGDKEYRFSIEEGVQSFAKITFDHCDYP